MTVGECIGLAHNRGLDTRLYNVVPGAWVAWWDGQLVEWPAEDDGWLSRKPWHGDPPTNTVDPANAAGTGWPVVDIEALGGMDQ